MKIEEPFELTDRFEVVVDSQVNGAIGSAAITATLPHDDHGSRLAAPPITAGGLTGRECREQPESEFARAALEALRHALDDLGSGQDVSLTAIPRSGDVACPVEALCSGETGRRATRIDDT